MIVDLLKEENIEIDGDVSTWQEAGKKVGSLLVKQGYVTQNYVDTMIETVEFYGPYIVIMEGVALFHARPDDGVKSVCMSLMTLKEGVCFNADRKDPVKLVVAFGAINNSSHVKALRDLMSILQVDNIVHRLTNITDKKMLINEIKNILGD